MRKIRVISALTGLSLILAACGAPGSNSGASAESLSVPIQDTQGAEIGKLTVNQIKGGGVDVKVSITSISPGIHAMHFHEFGRCDGPDFKSAGGHYNPAGAAHGHVEDGPHAGDMMNVEANAEGNGSFNVTNDKVNIAGGSLPALKDADGTALIIHAGADDYESQPSGAAGPRIACAVIPAG
jgi:Cu-Zn family superoxide dismutase